MAATLIAVIFALALGHLAPGLAATVRRHGIYGQWLRGWNANNPASGFWRGRYGIVCALLPPVLVVGLLQYVLHAPLLGALGLLFGVAALFHAWGPRDLDTDVAAIIDADDPATKREAIARLGVHGAGDTGGVVVAVFQGALRRWFGVLFWFLVLGAAGAVLYRLVALSAEGEFADGLPEDTRAGARTLLALLDWPVTQLMTFSLMVVGNFDTVLGAWRDNGGASFRLGQGYLGAAARASVRREVAEETQEFIEEGATPGNAWLQLGTEPELRDAMSLVWRVLLGWLVVLAGFVIAGWVS